MPKISRAVIFEIPPRGYEELAAIANASSRLEEVVEALRQLGVETDRARINEAVAERIGISPAEASSIVGGLLSLRTLLLATSMEPGELVAAITRSLEVSAPEGWRSKNLDAWRKSIPAITDALSGASEDDALSIRSKTQELTFLHQNVLKDCRLLTELRPVYNKAADKIENAVITTTMYLRYRGGGREREIEFTMDLRDVAELRKQCERVQQKVATTERIFKNAGWKLTVPGGSEDGDGQ